MIIAIVGGIGSGKSLFSVKRAIESPYHCFVNFDLKAPNTTRLKKENIILTEETTGPRGAVKKSFRVNWQFWNDAIRKHGNFHIILDEVHNIFHSRKAMSGWNVQATEWISQIRKLLGDSEKTHLYLITQKVHRLDVAFRDLLHKIIACKSIKMPYLVKMEVMERDKSIVKKKVPIVRLFQFHFTGDYALENYLAWSMSNKKAYSYRTSFIGNAYFDKYNTFEVFGESAYL